jgi:zinc carboxypeptidase
MNKTLVCAFFLVVGWCATPQDTFANDSELELSYYLPTIKQSTNPNSGYKPSIPTPEQVLGFQVGQWHARPEQIERYFRSLADSSPRVTLKTYAYSHEKRPLFLVLISSEKNINQLEVLRKNHLLMEKQFDRPAVTWMGYSVHGNEASGSNASLLLGYHLAAAQDSQTLEQLDDQIIIIDPMLNPDGLARFAHWTNMYKSKNPNSDANTREHNEAWPGGRTNHYWFDLNRDWLLLQHPESKGRVSMFHQWKPNVLTDFHEMGTNSTYFFQPGVESRQNPLTPVENFELTQKIAKYHAAALDEIGSLYYSKENFDDFYYGKGSTYPDINGAIGILFEQASARGHVQESVNGLVSFPFAIKNHLTTSFSTLKAVQENRKSLLRYQRNFYKKSQLKVKSSRTKAIVYGSVDSYRLQQFNQVLDGHQIKYYPLSRPLDVGGKKFAETSSYVVPLNQQQASLITAIFEKRKTFKDNTFYDVSSWTLPLAFDIDYQLLTRSDFDYNLLAKTKSRTPEVFEQIEDNTIALAYSWNDFSTAILLNYLHREKIAVRVVTKTMRMNGRLGYQTLNPGDLIVPVRGAAELSQQKGQGIITKSNELSLAPMQLISGLALSGPDAGSPSVPLIAPIKPLLLVGERVNSYQAGEVWHLLDQRLEQDLTMITIADFSKLKSIPYTHILMVDGSYQFSAKAQQRLTQWIKNGGILMSQSGASKWIAKQGWLSSELVNTEPSLDTQISYDHMDDSRSKHIIGGAITGTRIDLSHPLAFGLSDGDLAVFKRGTLSFTEPKEAFVSVARFNSKPLVAGYMSEKNREQIGGKTSMLVQALGQGKLIVFSDDMNFRGFWLGTSRVFVNALYFGEIIRAVGKTEDKDTAKIVAPIKK